MQSRIKTVRRALVVAVVALAGVAPGAGGCSTRPVHVVHVEDQGGASIDEELRALVVDIPDGLDTPTPGGAQVVGAFMRMPSGVAVYGDRVFLSFPRWVEDGSMTVAEWVDGRLEPYPSTAHNDIRNGSEALHSVNGIRIDARGRLWMLDNGRVNLGPASPRVPKVVVWDIAENREVFRHVFDAEVAPPGSGFLNDIVVSTDHGFAYITESGIGGTPALLVLDITRDRAWRVLDGHASVRPEPDVEMALVDGVVTIDLGDGPVPWRVAANPIALSVDGRVLYFGAMTARTLWQVPTEVLRDAGLHDAAREEYVTPFASKEATDGIVMRSDGALFLTNVERGGVDLVHPDGVREAVVTHSSMIFPVAVAAGSEDDVWVTSNQMHLMPLVRGGVDERTPPYFLWRAEVSRLAPPPPEDDLGADDAP